VRQLAIGLLCLMLAPSGALASPPPPQPTVITNPDWVQIPNGADMADAYPPVAQFIGLSGRAVLHCDVSVQGATVNCTIEGETPIGMGFGKAALALSKQFKMRPMTRNGVPVEGGEIRIPIRFAAPSSDESADESPQVKAAVAALAPQRSEPSPKALAIARRIAALSFNADQTAVVVNTLRSTLPQQFGGASLTEQEKAALDDYTLAVGASMPARAEAMAQSYAQRLSEKQLADADAFLESPSGIAWVGLSGRDAAKVSADLEATEAAEARKRFCGQFACIPDAPATAAPAQ
jgi:TonB family protein